MALALGTDLVAINRVAHTYKRHPQFAQRILTPRELAVFQTKVNSAAMHYLAKRWAAKEAAAKALGTGIAQGVSFQQIEVLNHEDGQPQLSLDGVAAQIFTQQGFCHKAISLADEKDYALAFVVFM